MDTVVLAVGVKAENALEQQLRSAGLEVYNIGDSSEPRQVLEAVKEGHETAIAL